MGAEIRLEQVNLALETTRGTPVTPPTHRILMEGPIVPNLEFYDDETNIGLLAGLSRSELIHSSSTWSAEGALDVWTLPVLLNMAFAVVTTPTTPTNGILTRLWTFIRNVTSDTIKSATLYTGDPNDKMYQAAFAMLTSLGWGADATAIESGTQTAEGIAGTFTPLGAVPTLPALGQAPLLIGTKMQLWIDTASAHGTTEVTGRLAAADVNIDTGVVPKYVAVGPAGAVTYTRIGREATVPELNLTLEKVDEIQLNQALAATTVKVRVRWNGSLIESVTPDYYNYVQVDMVGKLRSPNWADVAGTNRAVQLTLRGQYDATLATDIKAYVQNTKTGL